MGRARPVSITLLALFAGFAAIIAFIYALQMLNLFPENLGNVSFFGIDWLGAVLWGALALINIWLVRLLWNPGRRGWIWTTVFSVLAMLLAGMSISGGSEPAAMGPMALVSGLMLVLLIMPHAREAFATR